MCKLFKIVIINDYKVVISTYRGVKARTQLTIIPRAIRIAIAVVNAIFILPGVHQHDQLP